MKDEEFYKNLGIVLRAEREKRNLSQQEIADKLTICDESEPVDIRRSCRIRDSDSL